MCERIKLASLSKILVLLISHIIAKIEHSLQLRSKSGKIDLNIFSFSLEIERYQKHSVVIETIGDIFTIIIHCIVNKKLNVFASGI